MRSLSAATAVALGALAVAAPTSSAATTPSRFSQQAGALCQSYFGTVKAEDAELAGHLGDDPSEAAQILETAELLHTNATLSLATEGQLAALSAPRGDTTLWAALLEIDRTSGLLTLETSAVLVKLIASEQNANAAVSAYTGAYEKLESAWNEGVKALAISGCE